MDSAPVPESGIQRTKQEKHAQRLEERAEEGRRLAQGRTLRRFFAWCAGLAALALIGWFVWRQFPDAPDYSRAFPVQGRDHIAFGGNHPPYNSNPPTSGWHYADPAETGFHETAFPDEQLVHNLEHGDVWIAYHPRISGAVKEQLKEFVGAKVVATPRAENEFDISLAAWGRLDGFDARGDTLDVGRIHAFIARYLNTGPEKVPPGL